MSDDDEHGQGPDSGEHALRILKGENGEGGILDRVDTVAAHLQEVDVALYKRDIVWRALIGLLVIVFVLTVINAYWTASRGALFDRIDVAVSAVVESERTNQELNRQMLDLVHDSREASIEVADYVRELRDARAAGEGQSAAVARALAQIDQLAAAFEEYIGQLPPPTPTPTLPPETTPTTGG